MKLYLALICILPLLFLSACCPPPTITDEMVIARFSMPAGQESTDNPVFSLFPDPGQPEEAPTEPA